MVITTHKMCVALLLFIATFALLFDHSNAQNSPQDFLNAHNTARRQMGIPDLTWNTTLEAYARDYANQRIDDCAMVHSGGQYGENLAAGSSPSFSGVEAVKLWMDERAYYDYNINTCNEGRMCGHYTQVVWRNTQRIGCVRAQCNNGWVYVICSYDPPGNFVGERPYYIHSTC